ncbi:MAG: MBL fold metallo-hydrolase [Candidatus Pacebacteria bacterium]|nr:MBL fold metallo-hydrolase [Candidatus Paceibacterota bacterium]
MKITKLGHCCLLIESRGVRFLTDPGNYTTAQNTQKGIHYIVISHEHTDHLHVESVKTILANNPDAKIICNSGVGAILAKEHIPFTKVSIGESHDCNGVNVSAHGTKHETIYKSYEQVENTGYMFDDKLFYPGDAFHKPDAPVDILAFPVTGPWCTIAKAVDYVLEVKPRIAFPVHDGNLIRQNGITVRLPGIELPKAEITFLALELGKETEL